jgi:hypothetical protein
MDETDMKEDVGVRGGGGREGKMELGGTFSHFQICEAKASWEASSSLRAELCAILDFSSSSLCFQYFSL